MFAHSFISISSGVVISLILFISEANGITNWSSNQCAQHNHECDPHSLHPCCGSILSCKLKKSRSEFVCGEKGEIGASCVTDEDCWEIKHTKCSTEKKCDCRANNLRLNETYCAPSLGGFCWKNETCVTRNALCIDNECRCRKNYSASEDQCLPVIGSLRCRYDRDCARIRFAKCSKNKYCVCSLNTAVINNTSCESLLVNYCTTHSDCQPINSICKNNKCQCRPEYVAVNSNQCIRPHLGMSCTNDDFCKVLISNTICTENKTCICDQDSYLVNQGAYISSLDTIYPPRDECRVKNANCLYNTCWYNSTKGFSGKFCTQDDNCYGSLIGEDCSDDKDCQPYFSRCFHGRCECKDDYSFYSIYNCRPKFLDQDCRDNADCSAIINAECKNFKCACKINYGKFDEIACFSLLGNSCTINAECIVDNAFCSDRVCKCRKDYIPLSNKKCLSKILKRECITDYDCHTIKFSSCSEQSKCTCNQKYVALDETKCAALLGEYCSDDNSCWGANTLCHDNKCCCKQHFKDNFNYQCVPMYLGESCENNDDCMMIQHAQCSTNKKCFCQEAYIAVNATACKALLGENCEQDADCYAENSICMDNKCRCKNFFAADPSNSKCQSSALGKQCNELEDCSIILNSVCSSNGICICPPNYFAIGNHLCAPTINSDCLSDEECLSGVFRCVDSKCQCIHGYTAISVDRCVNTNSLYSCKETSECSDSWHWNCASNGKCVCHLDNFALNNSTCLPLLNGYCWKDNQCLAENSVCIDYRCGCNPNHVQAASNLCVLHNEN